MFAFKSKLIHQLFCLCEWCGNYFFKKSAKGSHVMKKILTIFLTGFLVFAPVLAAALETGEEAPLFEAVSDKGPINLFDYRGVKNVVLAFYFADFSPV
jgi:peroxiredoxin Q/BCP